LLVRRDGEEVLFLNELRHRKDTALKLRAPLARLDLPAVQAVLGREGIFRGRDYRGVETIAALRAVPGTSWFLVAKMDEAEAFEAWRLRSLLILAAILAFGAASAVAVGMAWQNRRKEHYKALFQIEQERRQAEERYRVTLLSVGDAVIVTGAAGRVELLNPTAERLTGWRQEEARGKPLPEVFRILNEKTREPVESPVERVMREGLVVGLGNHTVLVARDGTERPIADSGAPIRDEAGAITGVVLVFRDQTEERVRGEGPQRKRGVVPDSGRHDRHGHFLVRPRRTIDSYT
jgi:two-component system cell cycle sensor histidine kinase/response regulator CckA